MKYEYLDIFGTKLHDQLQKIMVDIQDASKAEEDAHKVERNIHESMRVIGFNLLEYFFYLETGIKEVKLLCLMAIQCEN